MNDEEVLVELYKKYDDIYDTIQHIDLELLYICRQPFTFDNIARYLIVNTNGDMYSNQLKLIERKINEIC